jgi:hypothetical protein
MKSPSAALGSNLFGALVGGLLEYLDMWMGLRALNLIALALYLVSFWFLYRSQRFQFKHAKRAATQAVHCR